MTVLLSACEQPSPVGLTGTTNVNLSTILTVPDSVTLEPGQGHQFAA